MRCIRQGVATLLYGVLRRDAVAPAGGEPLELLGKGVEPLVRAAGAAAHERRELAERTLEPLEGRALAALAGGGSLPLLVVPDGARRRNDRIHTGGKVKRAAAVGCVGFVAVFLAQAGGKRRARIVVAVVDEHVRGLLLHGVEPA